MNIVTKTVHASAAEAQNSTTFWPGSTAATAFNMNVVKNPTSFTCAVEHVGNTGSSTTDFTLQVSRDGTTWIDDNTYTQVTTGASNQTKTLAKIANYVRLKVVYSNNVGMGTFAAFFQYDSEPGAYMP